MKSCRSFLAASVASASSSLLLAALGLFLPLQEARAAGVTIITHGHLANATEWVIPMAAALPRHTRFPSSLPNDYSCYQITVVATSGGFSVTPTFLAGLPPTSNSSGEIFIKLDWSDIANDLVSDSTINIAAAVVPRLLQTNFIAGLQGRALAELPLHFIGHSRGGSLVCEMARLLGLQGVWVDHVTLLDPHPANNDGFSDPLLPFVTDASARIYENVLYADNYWETNNSYPKGKSVAGCYNRLLTSLNGGYSSAHSDVHLWYHATIDWTSPVSDTQASLTAADRQAWFNATEASGTNAGYYLSRIARGPRTADTRPAGPGTSRLADGFNQRWALGVTGTNNRAALQSNAGLWPNPITARLSPASPANALTPGDTLSLEIASQFARPATSNHTLAVFLDTDRNPWNGATTPLTQVLRPGSTATNVRTELLAVTVPANDPPAPGTYQLAVLLADGPRRRYAYLETPVTIAPAAPSLVIHQRTATTIEVQVTGSSHPGLVLEQSANLQGWSPVATNLASRNPWPVQLPFNAGAANPSFFRARLP